MNTGKLLMSIAAGLCIASIVIDRIYVAGFQKQFQALEKERILTANKLATAKIIQENLNHVRDLVLQNMTFDEGKDSISHDTHFFNFITQCMADLKMTLVAVKPLRPETVGAVTTHGYELEVEGDFFTFGELCAKFENSRRIMTPQSFDVTLVREAEKKGGGAESDRIRAIMRIDTYRIRKA
jgi:hypothetical protein